MDNLKRIIYVSQSAFEKAEVDLFLPQLIENANTRNNSLGVSGGLIYTGHRFGQCIEGPESCIDTIMDSIIRDVRHSEIRVVENKAISERTFINWGLVYSGSSFYVDRHLKAAQTKEIGLDHSFTVDKLRAMMLLFTRSPGWI